MAATDRPMVLVLGAGFSKAAGGPLVPDLLSPRCLLSSGARHEVLADVMAIHAARVAQQPSYSAEDLFTEIWSRSKSRRRLTTGAREYDPDLVLQELRYHLSSLCSDITLRGQAAAAALYKGFFSRLLAESSSLAVLTFNYDRLVEETLERLGLPWTYGLRHVTYLSERQGRAARSRRAVPVLKLHGSTTWAVCASCAGTSRSDVVAHSRAYKAWKRRTACECGEYMEPGLVPPITMKPSEMMTVGPIWDEAESILAHAARVLIIGYSLPAADAEARSLLGQVRHRGIPITVVDPAPTGAHEGVLGQLTRLQQTFSDFAQGKAPPARRQAAAPVIVTAPLFERTRHPLELRPPAIPRLESPLMRRR